MNFSSLQLKPRHKWFAHYSLAADDGYYGPHNTIEPAIAEVLANHGIDETGRSVYVFQGYKMTKKEQEEWGMEYEWQCDTENRLAFTYGEGPKIQVTTPVERLNQWSNMSDSELCLHCGGNERAPAGTELQR